MGIIAVFVRPHTGFLCKRTECFVTVFRGADISARLRYVCRGEDDAESLFRDGIIDRQSG